MIKILILTLLLSGPLQAAELFGVALLDAERNQLRLAVKSAGVKLLREAGDDAFFDVYQSDGVMVDSNHLYLGFVKKDNRFAFAEYEFNGLQQPEMLSRLTARYGKPIKSAGKFLTDQSYRWQSNGITIALYADWKAYKTRLLYFNPTTLRVLQDEQEAYVTEQDQRQKRYLPQGY